MSAGDKGIGGREMRVSIKVNKGSLAHLQALFLQKDLTRKQVAQEMKITTQHLGRAFVERNKRQREKVIEFIGSFFC